MIKVPKHPGKIVKSLCLEPMNLSVTQAAKSLKVSRSTLSKLMNGHIGMSADMAIRLGIVFNSSEELGMTLQSQYNMWKAKQHKENFKVNRLNPSIRKK